MSVKIKIITESGDKTAVVRSEPIPNDVDDKTAFIDQRTPDNISVESIEIDAQ